MARAGGSRAPARSLWEEERSGRTVIQMHAGKGTDAQLKVRSEARAELLRPALQDPQLALHASDRYLGQAHEGVQGGSHFVRQAVERTDDQFAQGQSVEDVEVLDELAFICPFCLVVAPGEAFEVDAET